MVWLTEGIHDSIHWNTATVYLQWPANRGWAAAISQRWITCLACAGSWILCLAPENEFDIRSVDSKLIRLLKRCMWLIIGDLGIKSALVQVEKVYFSLIYNCSFTLWLVWVTHPSNYMCVCVENYKPIYRSRKKGAANTHTLITEFNHLSDCTSLFFSVILPGVPCNTPNIMEYPVSALDCVQGVSSPECSHSISLPWFAFALPVPSDKKWRFVYLWLKSRLTSNQGIHPGMMGKLCWGSHDGGECNLCLLWCPSSSLPPGSTLEQQDQYMSSAN